MTDLRPAAVLFDMDGTLFDSEKVWAVGLYELAASYGGRLSEDARLRMVGTMMGESMRILHDDIGQPWRDIDASADWLDARMAELFVDGLEWRAGARELLAAVREAGLPTGLVTSTRRPLVEVAMLTLGPDNFDVVICGDDVARPKPDPMPYVTAAEALGVDPGDCVAIEDSPTGVASAVGAGCAVIAVPNDVPLPPDEAYHLLASLVEVDVALLRELAHRSTAES